MIFTHEPVSTVKPKIEGIVMNTKAKVGDIAQCEVTIKKGPTGIAPADIKFFQALKMTTKIFKSQIEILTDKQLFAEGDVVDVSSVQLLEKLGIMPFSYGMKVLHVYDDGQMLDAALVAMTPDDYA